tara:strand:+ start:400 stop:1416 length:1017 start_codon:yes stop_codon:yes gene_type:complete
MGKARDGSECYTRQNKSGGNYVTCEGSQQKSAARQKPKVDWLKSDTARGRARRAAITRKFKTRPDGRIDTGIINPGIIETRPEFALFGATPQKNIDPRLPFSSRHAILEAYEPDLGPDIASTTAPGYQVTTLPGDIYEIRDTEDPEDVASGDAKEEYVGKVSKEFVKIEFVQEDESDYPDFPTEEKIMSETNVKNLKQAANRFANHSGRGDFPEEYQKDFSGIKSLKGLSKPEQIKMLQQNILKGIEIEKSLYRPPTPDPDVLPPGTMLLLIDGDKIFDKNPEFDNDSIMRFEWDSKSDNDDDDESDDDSEDESEFYARLAGVVMPKGPKASYEGLFG